MRRTIADCCRPAWLRRTRIEQQHLPSTRRNSSPSAFLHYVARALCLQAPRLVHSSIAHCRKTTPALPMVQWRWNRCSRRADCRSFRPSPSLRCTFRASPPTGSPLRRCLNAIPSFPKATMQAQTSNRRSSSPTPINSKWASRKALFSLRLSIYCYTRSLDIHTCKNPIVVYDHAGTLSRMVGGESRWQGGNRRSMLQIFSAVNISRCLNITLPGRVPVDRKRRQRERESERNSILARCCHI